METKSNQAQYKLLELYANRILQSIESCQNAFEEKSVKEYLDGEQAKASTNFGILWITSEFLQLEKRVNDLLALFKETGGNSYAAYLKSKEKKIISGISERYTERE